MLTPTGVTYVNYWNAIKAGNPTHVRFTFLGQGIVLEDEDVLLSSGVNLTDMFNGDTDLVFGRTLSKQITVTFINSDRLDGLQWTGEFTLEFGVEINGTTNWVTMGYFSGEKPNNVTSAQTIQFTAYDRMGLFDALADEFVKSLTYPKTVAQIYDALCTYVGLQKVSGDELASIMSRSFSSAPAEMKGYTCRDILSWIAEACGCYAKITSAGKVKMVWFTDNTAHAVTGTEEFRVESGDIHDGMTWDEADTYTWNEFDNFTWDDVCGYQEALRVNRLYVKQLSSDMDINYPNSYGDNVYAIVDNPFLSVSTYSDVTTYLAPIYNRLYSFGGYLPVQLECVGNWCVEAGDIITIDVNAQTITFPVFVKTMRWSGAINDSYETTASGKRQIYNSEATKQKVLSSNKIEMYVTEAESEMQTYTDGQVSGAKSYADGKVTDALNTVDQNYYKIRSGISITVDGVTISGSKYINIESGSKIDIKNGADLDVESGGDINLKSGGKLNLASGSDIEVNSGGDVNIKSGGKVDVASGGDIDIESGGDVNVKSGGNINVASGGNFNIASGGSMNVNASGTLALTGSSVSITSGSTFEVSATNYWLSSANRTMRLGAWYYNALGISYDLYNTSDCMFGIGEYSNAGYRSGTPMASIVYENNNSPKLYHFLKSNTDNLQRLVFSLLSSGILISGGQGSINQLGTQYDDKWDIYARNYYNASSREQKHNIMPMESVGEKLDKLEPVTFVYDDDENEKQRMGLIYEDAVEIMPIICTNDESNKSISYLELVPALLKEIQELRIRVKTLEEREV